VLSLLAEVAHEADDWGLADTLYSDALPILDEVDDLREEGWCRANRASLHHESGQLERALEGYRKAWMELAEVGDALREGLVVARLTAVVKALGHREEADRGLQTARDIVAGLGEHLATRALDVYAGREVAGGSRELRLAARLAR
jgi:tetratricopeptide (TPR) repeat protein